MNDKYNKLEIAVIIVSIICWIVFIIMFIIGFTKPPFEHERVFENIYSGLLGPIFITPFFAIPLLILSIILKRKKGNIKIYKLGIITFIITFIIPLLLIILPIVILTIISLIGGGVWE